MDVMFSLLDGACALWLSLFSPHRYLRMVVSINLAGTGARRFFESYIKTNLVPVVVLGSLYQFNFSVAKDNITALLAREDRRFHFPAGELESIYQHVFLAPANNPLSYLMTVFYSEKLLSISLLFGALATYYSLRRSREFGRNARKMRHALQFITTNALTLSVLQVAQAAIQSISFLSIDVDGIALPAYQVLPPKQTIVQNAIALASANADSSGVHIFLGLLVLLVQVIYLIVAIRVFLFLARSFRIGFWRSVWLQSRFALPLAAVPFSLVIAISAGLKPINIVIAGVVVLLLVGGTVIAMPSGRRWLSRRAAPAPRRRVAGPRSGGIVDSTLARFRWFSRRTARDARVHTCGSPSARVRIAKGALEGTVVPVAATIVVGRDPSKAGIVFPADDTSVSRRHCEIRFDRAAALFEVRDLGSRNGTFIASDANGARRLVPDVVARVRPGQSVYVGSTRARLVLELS